MASCVENKQQSNKQKLEDLEARIASGARTVDPLAELLHMEILWADPQEAEGILRVSPELCNPYGSVHGGCLVALADSVAGHNMAAAGKLCVTLSTAVNFLRSATGPVLYCRSRIQKLGKRVSVVEVETRDAEATLLLTAHFTFSTIKEIPPHIISAQEDIGENQSAYLSGF